MDEVTLDVSYVEQLKPKFIELFVRYIKPSDVLHMFHQIMSIHDISNIKAEISSRGEIAGSTLLFERLIRYKGWYKFLLDLLCHKDVRLDHVADQMRYIKDQLDIKISQESETSFETEAEGLWFTNISLMTSGMTSVKRVCTKPTPRSLHDRITQSTVTKLRVILDIERNEKEGLQENLKQIQDNEKKLQEKLKQIQESTQQEIEGLQQSIAQVNLELYNEKKEKGQLQEKLKQIQESTQQAYHGNFVKCDNADINSMSFLEVESTIIADETVEKSRESEGTKHILSNAKDVDMEVVATPDAFTTAQSVDNYERQEDAIEVEYPAQLETIPSDATAESSVKFVQTEAACVPSHNNILALETEDDIEENNVDMEDEYKGHTETLAHPVSKDQEDSLNRGDSTPDTKVEDTASTAILANNNPADQILTEKSSNDPTTQEVTDKLSSNPAQATVESHNQEHLTSLQTTKVVGSISHNIGGTDQDFSGAIEDSTSGGTAKSTTEQATAEAGDQISAPAATSANTIYRSGPEPTALNTESSGPTVPDTKLNPVPDKSKGKNLADSSGPEDSHSNTVPGLTEGKNPAETVIDKVSADQVPAIDSQNSVAPESDTDNLGGSCVSSTLDSNLRDNKNIAKPDISSSNNLGDSSDSAKPGSLKSDQARDTRLSPTPDSNTAKSVDTTPDSNTAKSVDNQNSAPADQNADNLGDNQNSASLDIHDSDQVKDILHILTPDSNKLEEFSETDGEKKEPSAEGKPKETDIMGCISSNNSADEDKAYRMSSSKTIVKASPSAVSLMAKLEGLFYSFSHWICWRLHLLLHFFQKDPNSSTKKNKKSSGSGSNDNSGNNHNKRPKPYRPGDRDTEKYRNGYPGQKDDTKAQANWLFYNNDIKSEPDGDFIDNIHQNWKGDYRKLERHHGYIQWLFPIREHGMNYQAQPLQLHEAQKIMSNSKAKRRVLESYRLMLDFYGMELVDESTGKLQRSENYIECFDNLSWNSHNYLRITRILKSLGELGYEHLKKPFLEFVLNEALVEKTLAKTLSSCENYWIGTVKNDDEREELYQMIEKYKNKK